jgi:DNA-binding NarL/FixJ family response regulator
MKVLVALNSFAVCERIIGVVTEYPIGEVFWDSPHIESWFEDAAVVRPDVVILGAGSGSRGGIELMRKAKRMGIPPIVIMTSDIPYRQYKRECLREGADYFYYLPEEIDLLIGTICSLAGVLVTDSTN